MIWALTDTATMARRELAHWRQRPGAVVVGWLFPVLIVLMFGGPFGGAIAVPDGGDYIDFGNPGHDAASWPATHAVPLAVAVPLALTAVLLPLAVRRYRRLGG
jgi:hypothetical protein